MFRLDPGELGAELVGNMGGKPVGGHYGQLASLPTVVICRRSLPPFSGTSLPAANYAAAVVVI
jgi:hypothetical protein